LSFAVLAILEFVENCRGFFSMNRFAGGQLIGGHVHFEPKITRFVGSNENLVGGVSMRINTSRIHRYYLAFLVIGRRSFGVDYGQFRGHLGLDSNVGSRDKSLIANGNLVTGLSA